MNYFDLFELADAQKYFDRGLSMPNPEAEWTLQPLREGIVNLIIQPEHLNVIEGIELCDIEDAIYRAARKFAFFKEKLPNHEPATDFLADYAKFRGGQRKQFKLVADNSVALILRSPLDRIGEWVTITLTYFFKDPESALPLLVEDNSLA